MRYGEPSGLMSHASIRRSWRQRIITVVEADVSFARDLFLLLQLSLGGDAVQGARQLKQSGCPLCDLLVGLPIAIASSTVDDSNQLRNPGVECQSAWDVINHDDDLSEFAQALESARWDGARSITLRDLPLSITHAFISLCH